jgi:predicted Zn-dependent protease
MIMKYFVRNNVRSARLAALLALGCLALSVPAQAQKMTDVEEIELGRRISREAEEYWGGVLPDKHPMSQRVRRIGSMLSRLSKRRYIPYTYKVLDNERILNAFAAPGGKIYVTKRLLRFVSNDAELASILGHETAHIDQRHTARRFEERRRSQRVAQLWRERILGKGVGETTFAITADIAWIFKTLAYSRSDEREADLWGARSMSHLGFDPRASVSVMKKIQGKDKRSALARYLSTHPAPEERAAILHGLITREKLLDIAQRRGGPKLWFGGKAVPVPKSTSIAKPISVTKPVSIPEPTAQPIQSPEQSTLPAP